MAVMKCSECEAVVQHTDRPCWNCDSEAIDFVSSLEEAPNEPQEPDFVENILLIIGWLSIVGGIIAGFLNMDDSFWGMAVYFIVSGFISGFLFFGFAKALYYLRKIKDKLYDE